MLDVKFHSMFLCLSMLGTVSATAMQAADNEVIGRGIQKRVMADKRMVAAVGPIVDEPTGLCLKDLMKEHETDLLRLNKRLRVKDVKIIAARDDYWYYSLQAKGNRYGVANQNGEVVLAPIYQSVYYCPVMNDGVDAFLVKGDYMEKADTFHVHHPYSRGTFLACDGVTTRVTDVRGKVLRTINGPVTFYHGFLIGGVRSEEINFTDRYGFPSLLAANANEASTVSLMTQDGRSCYADLQAGIQMDDYQHGQQVVFSYQYDADHVARKGGYVFEEPDKQIPAIFGEAFFDYDEQQWLVCPNRMMNAMPYDPSLHSSVHYMDEGERLFYQNRYDDCIAFYAPVIADSARKAQQLWASFYTAASFFEKGSEHKDRFLAATVSFEDVSLRTYPSYYDRRFEMMGWADNDIAGMHKAIDLLDYYQKTDTLLLFSYEARSMLNSLRTDVYVYENFKERYRAALATLDMRIAQQKEEDRIRAEQEAAENAATAAAVTGIFMQSLGNIASGLAGGSSSSTTSASRSSGTAVHRTSGGGSSSSSSSSSSSDDSGSGKDVKEVHENCHSCGGNGKCNICNGSGRGPKLGMNVKCDACNGSGKCSICKGKGYKVRYKYQ